MTFDVALVGESWESAFARRTAASLRDWLPEGSRLSCPASLEVAVREAAGRPVEALGGQGFLSWEAARALARPRDGRGLLVLAAGTLPARARPVERLGAAWSAPRAVEWMPPEGVSGPTALHFGAPPHRPPTRPEHRPSRVGKLAVWSVDTGDGYFPALLSSAGGGAPPLWSQYGRGVPAFAYNTSDFREPAPAAGRADFVILGSGLLGLRMVLEGGAREGRVLVYDINPAQLDWVRHLLESCERELELEAVVRSFERRFPGAAVRPVLPHERENAARQAEWYARHRHELSSAAKRLEWRFLECDLLTDPAPVLEWISPGRPLFFMYLDLFLVWHLEGPAPWIERFDGLAASLRAAVSARAGADVAFLPAEGAGSIQLPQGSPFAEA